MNEALPRERRKSADHALDLFERVVASGDGQRRRRFGQVGGIHERHDLRRHRHRLAAGVLRGDRDGVVGVGPLRAGCVLAVPYERRVAGVQRVLDCARLNGIELTVCPVALVMVTVPVAGLGTERFQIAVPFESCVVAPSTPTVWPTNSRAAVFCAVFCKDTSVAS